MKKKTFKNTGNRRISLQVCSNSQQKKDQESISEFQKTKMLLQLLKKTEYLIFNSRQNDAQFLLRHINNQNNLMSKISQKLKCQQELQEESFSSVYVLEEMDIDNQDAFGELERQNREIKQRIQKLENNLLKLEGPSESMLLQQLYIRSLKDKTEKYAKVRDIYLKESERIQESKIQKVEEAIKQVDQRIFLKYGSLGKKLMILINNYFQRS